MVKYILLISISTGLLLIACKNNLNQQNQASRAISPKADTSIDNHSIVYESGNLTIRKISENVYEHISFLQTNSFGKVSCNGMIVVNNNEAVVFDTPTNNENSQELINYLTSKFNCKLMQ